MTTVKIKLSAYEVTGLDELLTAMLIPDPTSSDADRCVLGVLTLWHIKIKKLMVSLKQNDNSIKVDAITAYALRAAFSFDTCNPTDPLDNKLLRLMDDIQKTFYSPILLIPQLHNNGTAQN